jgi:hypothetical protein
MEYVVYSIADDVWHSPAGLQVPSVELCQDSSGKLESEVLCPVIVVGP